MTLFDTGTEGTLGQAFEDAAARVLGDHAQNAASPWHGRDHWERVYRNARVITDAEGRQDVFRVAGYFALIHDCERENDQRDPEHGIRAARYATKLRSDGLVSDLTDEEFGALYTALALHDKGFTLPPSPDTGYVTIAVCWDADRLDLGRVGKQPDPRFLTTRAAKQRASSADS